MAEYRIIDIHTHTYPTRELGLAVKSSLKDVMGDESYSDYDGTIPDLQRAMEDAKVLKAIMLNHLPSGNMKDVARSKLPANLSDEERKKAEKELDRMIAERYKRRNLWTCNMAKENPNLIPFISVDPVMDAEDMRSEILDKVENHGARGLKFESGDQRFYINDRRLWPAYESAEEIGLPIYIHSGRVFASDKQYAEPKYLEELLANFPKLSVVMGHLGLGYWEQALSVGKKYPRLSSCCTSLLNWQLKSIGMEPLSDEELVSLIRNFGVERIMFGSDYPIFDIARIIHDILELPLTEWEKRLILGENAIRIYGISI